MLINYYYYYYLLRLLAKRYEELLEFRLGKPLMDKNPRRSSRAPFLCSPLLVCDVSPLPLALPTIEKPARQAELA